MKLILIPLSILLLLGMLSVTGLGAETADYSQGFHLYDRATSQDAFGNYLYLYDETGHAIMYYNLTNVDDYGEAYKSLLNDNTLWRNDTLSAWTVYYDTNGQNATQWGDIHNPLGIITGQQDGVGLGGNQFNFSSSLSWVIIIGVIMGIGAIVGFKFFGSGESEISVEVLLKGTFYLTLWGILTAMAYSLIVAAGFFIYLLYFAIALVYTIGIMTNIGSTGNSD